MDKIGLHIPYLLIGILSWIAIIVVFITAYTYLSWLWDKIDFIYWSLWKPVSCQSLPYGIQDKIEQMSHTLAEDTTCNPNK